jgi:DNA adenine methylase
MEEVRVKRPVLRYHGGKWRLAKWVIGHFPAHRIYVEPFGGAASVLLQKPASFAEVYNDLDGQVVNVFRVLRDEKKAIRLIGMLELTPYSRAEFELSYGYVDDDVEMARRTIVRSFMGFRSDSVTTDVSTGFRGSMAFNFWRFCTHDWNTYPAELEKAIMRFKKVAIECLPACDVIEKCDTDETLFYCDPPYLPETRTKMREEKEPGGYRFEMSREDHVRLLNVLQKVKGMVVLSAYDSALYSEALKGWGRFETQARVQKACGGSRYSTEVLWLNAAAVKARRLPLFEDNYEL